MNFRRFTLNRRLFAAILIALYFLGYGWARSQRILVHRISYITEGGGKRYLHCVEGGDFGPGALLKPEAPFIIESCKLLFTPLRWVESTVWVVHSKAL